MKARHLLELLGLLARGAARPRRPRTRAALRCARLQQPSPTKQQCGRHYCICSMQVMTACEP